MLSQPSSSQFPKYELQCRAEQCRTASLGEIWLLMLVDSLGKGMLPGCYPHWGSVKVEICCLYAGCCSGHMCIFGWRSKRYIMLDTMTFHFLAFVGLC